MVIESVAARAAADNGVLHLLGQISVCGDQVSTHEVELFAHVVTLADGPLGDAPQLARPPERAPLASGARQLIDDDVRQALQVERLGQQIDDT